MIRPMLTRNKKHPTSINTVSLSKKILTTLIRKCKMITMFKIRPNQFRTNSRFLNVPHGQTQV
jgi:hypothetical protein